MAENYFMPLIVFSIGIFLYMIHLSQKLKEARKQNKIKANQSMLEDLALATSDQLLHELRKRPNFPHMLILPKQHKDYNSVALEIHSLSLVESFKILAVITNSAFNELKKKGIDVGEMSGGDIEDGEWHSEGFQGF